MKIDEQSIAIIGMSVRLPGALNVDDFWGNLISEKESISVLNDDFLRQAGIENELIKNPKYVKSAAILEKAEYFDAKFFDYTDIDAELMDPQHRQFLECAWEAFENAGINLHKENEKVGVFSGAAVNTYLLHFWEIIKREYQSPGALAAILHGNSSDYLSTKVSYKLNLKGPSLSVQTACSTSLAAVHLAVQSLLSYETDITMAGGVSVSIPQYKGYLCETGSIFSLDGHCRAFDAKASGTVFGSGVGVVILKRLQDAINNRDFIYGVIKATTMNNDGAFKSGYTAPSVEGQSKAISEALALAEVDPASISYIETHGTGTMLGDPIELAALKQAFLPVDEKHTCAIGSVKTNVGHLNAAAGIVGLIKTALALKHRIIPASLHFESPNPEIDFEDTPFYVNQRTKPWISDEKTPRRAGVSSFGIGGTNVHVIMEEAPDLPFFVSFHSYHLLLFSAKTNVALMAMKKKFKDFLQHTSYALEDIAYTFQQRRTHFHCRDYLIVDSKEQAIRQLQDNLLTKFTSNDDFYIKLVKCSEQWLQGESIDWSFIYAKEQRSSVPLPTYPFDSRYYSLDSNKIGSVVNNINLSEASHKKFYSRPELNQPYQAPKNDIENIITEVWSELFKIYPIGIHDNFYELGGDSLLGTQVLTRLEALFPLKFTLEDIDRNPTIVKFASDIDKRLAEKLSTLSESEIENLLSD